MKKEKEEKKLIGRKYLPTLSCLIDRLSIVQLKELFITEHRDEYSQEILDILHDIDLLINEEDLKIDAKCIRAIVALAIFNNLIWTNESNYRKNGSKDGVCLEFTHSANGIRNTAKNEINKAIGKGRLDFKIDCLAAEYQGLSPSF
jgi:hypothetical protein